MKTCTKCGVSKERSEFYVRTDGYIGNCRECERAREKARNTDRVKTWISENSERQRQSIQNWNNKNPERRKQLTRKHNSKTVEKRKLATEFKHVGDVTEELHNGND